MKLNASNRLIADFPSGSSINLPDGKLYVTGDDATHILILNKENERIDSIHLFNHSEKRIPKAEKVDLEGSAILQIKGIDHLLIPGSASKKDRKQAVLIPLPFQSSGDKILKYEIFKTKDFIKRVKAAGLEEVNLEGMTTVNDDLVLGNRGNRSMMQAKAGCSKSEYAGSNNDGQQ